MTDREVMKQALKALESGLAFHTNSEVLQNLRAALAEEALQRLTDVQQEIQAALEQPEQEPYAEQSRRVEQETQGRMRINPVTGDVGIGSPPPQRKPLTEQEIVESVRESDLDWQVGWTLDEDAPNRFITLARAIEQAHGIKE